jgi:hypothetical protein
MHVPTLGSTARQALPAVARRANRQRCVPSAEVTQDELQVAVLAFLDQFIGRGAADDVRDLRTRLVTDPATQARLADELPSSDASERETWSLASATL